MKNITRLFVVLAEETPNNSADDLKETMINIVKHPAFYIVIGALVLLIIAVYLLRRIIRPEAGVASIITRKRNIHKVIDEKSSSYFMVPFVEQLGAVISLGDRELKSDKLFINNGPDALYQINYTLQYKVTNPKGFYPYSNNINDIIINKLNDDLREFADGGNALVLVKDYRENAAKILSLINKAIEPYSVEATSFKINLIQPLGR